MACRPASTACSSRRGSRDSSLRRISCASSSKKAKYALVGRETLDGRDVLKIEYYPSRDCSAAAIAGAGRKRPNQDRAYDAEFQRLMNKVALVTLWVEPKAHQIVKYTFNNLPFDFLPGQWLLHVDDLRASMTMGAAVPGRMAAERPRVRVRHLARGRSGRDAVRARVPRLPPPRRHHQRQGPLTMWAAIVLLLLGGPAAVAPGTAWQGRETVAAIQVHGNTVTRDDEVRRLAGIEVGAPVDANTVDEVAARLRTAKRFDNVRVLKRFASIEDPSQILLVIIVDEGPVHIETDRRRGESDRVVRSHPLGLMIMPVLTREDGYGFTYGARLARRTSQAGTAASPSR